MSRPYRMVQVGTGGMGAAWCEYFLPPHVEAGNIEVVGAVDINTDALVNAREHLDVPPERCFTDVEAAFDQLNADFCTVVVPPSVHEDIVDAAIANEMHILSEKPIAETLSASVRIAEKVERAGLKMGVTMSHRFRDDITTLRRRIHDEESGALDYLVGRLHCSYREYGDWGATFRHEMDEPLLLEGAVHHLDLLADMADAKCTHLYAETWLPEWGPFADDAQALITMRFEDGTRVSYEGGITNASSLNGWGEEYIRAECRDETLILSGHELERHGLDADTNGPGTGEPLDLDDQQFWSHRWLIDQFVDWLDGGDPMPTNVRDNLQSMALIEAAMESDDTDKPVNPQVLLSDAESGVVESMTD